MLSLYLFYYRTEVKFNTPLGVKRILFRLKLYFLKYLLSLSVIYALLILYYFTI